MKALIQKQYDILIGLKDKDTFEQLLSTGKFIEIVSNICEQNRVGFSIKKMNGGYITKNGKYIKENSLNLTLNGITEIQAIKIAQSLKELLNQECILVTKNEVNTFIV